MWRSEGIIPAVIEEVTPSGSVYYIREPNGALIARVAGGSTHYYHFDALGSTRLLTDDDGVVTDTYTYDAWGNLVAHQQFSGSVDQPYQYVGQLGYYAHVQDENMDLLQLGVRFYDPETGRFTQVDAAGVHREAAYVYAADCPPSWFDPRGLKPVNAAGDHALKKCLSRLRKHISWTGEVIDKIGKRWYYDAKYEGAVSYFEKEFDLNKPLLMERCPPSFRYVPAVKFGGKEKTGPWNRRQAKGFFDDFCSTVLHELIHHKHGMWGMYKDAWREWWDHPLVIQWEAEDMYDKYCR